jgi:hypothetical protein
MSRTAINTSDVSKPESREVDIDGDLLNGSGKEILLMGQDLGAKEYARDLSFMNDDVTFSISPTTDKNEEKVVACSVNGSVRHFNRGAKYTVKRSFLNALIRTQSSPTVSTYVDAEGVSQSRVIEEWSAKYPISIINDPAGKIGSAWFEHQCKQPF